MITHTVTQFAVHQNDHDPLTDVGATHVELIDEGGGRFLEITQHDTDAAGTIRLEFAELEKLYMIARMLWQ